MLPFPNPSVDRGALRSVALISALATLFFSGCASPGPPRPPSLKLPQLVTDLTAERSGDQVLLHWTTPAKTTDSLAIETAITAKICRSTLPGRPPAPTAATVPCSPTLRVPVKPGASTAIDSLPAALTSDPVALITYRVEIENASGHSAGPSNPAFAASGSAPPILQNLRATAVPEGAMLEWAPASSTGPSSTFVELARVNPSLAATRQTNAKPRSSQPLQLGGQQAAEVRLRAKAPSEAGAEPAGTVDRTARFGETYRYSAQRVRTVQIGKHALELRSTATAPVSLTLRDTFPPAPPTGLAAIPGTSATQTSMDLSWEPGSEPDLAGYLVYRKAASDATPTRLSPTPLAGPAFRDLTAIPGTRYSYTVTAVDTSGNESAPGAPAEETLPKP
jgi:hypothetical protein